MDDLSGRRLFWSTAVLVIEFAALVIAYDEVFGIGDQKSDWVYMVEWPPSTFTYIILGCFVAITMVWPAGLNGNRRIRERPQAKRVANYLLSLAIASGAAAVYACALPGGTVESWASWGGLTLASAWPLHIFITPVRSTNAQT